MSMKTIKSISDQRGTISRVGGADVEVLFSLTQWQEFIDDEIPSMKSALGTLRFEDPAKASYFFNSGDVAVLTGSGIKASIIITSLNEFKVTGPITDIQ